MLKDPLFYKIVRPIIKGLFFLIYHPTIIGKENIPKEGRVVLAGNHTNNFDCLLLISSTKRCIHFLAKDSLYKGPKKIIFKNMGIIPVNRSVHDKKVLLDSIQILKNNGVIGIFPEGTINRTNNTIMEFKIGAVKMASSAESQIVPFTIKGKYVPFKKGPIIKFHKPYKISTKDLDKENKILMDKIKHELEKE